MSDTATAENRPQRGLGYIIFKNTAFVTAGTFVLKALNFLFGIFVVRRLGDSRFGQYSIVLAFVGLFEIFAELGMSQYAMREIARDRSKASSLFWNLVAVRLLLAILGIVGITLGAIAVGYTPELVLGVFIYTCSFLLAALDAPLSAVLTANERLDYVAALTVVGQVVFMVFGALFLFNGLGFVWLVVASVISILPRIGLAVWVIKRYHLATLPFQIHPSSWLGLIRSGLPFGMISLALTIGFRIDTVLLSKFQPDYVVGWYNLAYNLERSVLYFFASFSIAIVPSLTRAYVQDTSAVKRWYYRSVKFIALTALPLAVGGMLVAVPLIRSLYTDEFLPAVPSLRIIIWDIPFLMFSSFCGNITTAVSEERAAARIYVISAVVNVLLNLYAIPRFSLIGASVVTVITDLVAALQFYILLQGKLNLPNMTSVFVRVLIASAFMGIAIILAGERHLLVLIGLGIIVYGGLALALRLLDKEEWSMILRLLRRRRDPQPVGQTTEF